MITIELTHEQYELIATAIGYWAQDQYLMDEDENEEWAEQQEILNDPNFPF